MKLSELKDVIDDNTNVSLQTQSGNSLPLLFSSWGECKRSLTPTAWEQPVKLASMAGIQIIFTDL